MHLLTTNLFGRNVLLRYLGRWRDHLVHKLVVGLLWAVAVLVVVVGFEEMTGSDIAGRPFLFAMVLLASWFGGLPGGLAGSGVAVLALVFLTMDRNGESLNDEDAWYLIAFILTIFSISAFNVWRRSVEVDLLETSEALQEARLETTQALEDQRTATRTAQRYANQLARLHASLNALASLLSSDAICRVVAGEAAGALEARTAGVVLRADDGLRLVDTQTELDLPFLSGPVVPFDAHNPLTATFHDNKPLIFANGSQIRRDFGEAMGVVSADALAFLPLRIEGTTLGVLVLRFEGERNFGSEDVALMFAFANQAAQALNRAQLYEAERLARGRLEAVIGGVPGVVWEAWGEPDAASQRIDFISDHVQEMLGYSVREWLNTPNFWLQIVHPEDKERAAAEAVAIFESKQPGQSEFRWVTADRRIIWVHAYSNVILDEADEPLGMRGVTLDVSDRKRAEMALDIVSQASLILNASLEYESTLANLGNLLVPALADWYVVHLKEGDDVKQVALSHRDPAKVRWVRELQERLPPDPEALQGYYQIIRSGRPELLAEVTDKVLEAAIADEEQLTIARSLGLRSYVGVPILAQGEVIGALSLVTTAESGRTYDEESLKLTEEIGRRAGVAIENARLYRDSELARRELQESNRAKDEFLGIVSHELRTPITTIFGSARLLKRRPGALDEDAQQQLITGIEDESEKMARLIENLLMLARADLGAKIEFVSVELPSLVEKTVAAARRQAPDREFLLRHEADARSLVGEPTYIEQVLLNLLGNADKYSPHNAPIELFVERTDTEVRFRVLDRGPGVQPEELPLLFDSFYRSARTASTVPGKGLGLAVCKRLVEAQGGRIWALPRPGGGLEVGFALPLTLQDEASLAEGAALPD